jgi:hypothetical protein
LSRPLHKDIFLETIAKADIFFFITSIAVVVLTVIGLYLAYKILRLVRKLEEFVELVGGNLEDASDEIRALVSDLRESVLYRTIFKRRRRMVDKNNENGYKKEY